MKVIKKKILVVGQTPPPYGGQAVMIENMLRGSYGALDLYHVRMTFSKEMDEIGRFSITKVFHLFSILFRIIYYKFKFNISTLYYPPTGPSIIPFYRDVLILIFARPFFNKVCFHFHAAGLSELYPKLNFFSRFLFRQAYYRADVGIRLSKSSSDDCALLKVRREYIIPYGIDDAYSAMRGRKVSNTIPSILFVGLLSESKGILILLDACKALKNKGIDFTVNVIGKFESKEFETKVQSKIAEYDLARKVKFLGVCIGEEKFNNYLKSDIFCFPSFFEAESFPVVLLEASCFGLPIVSTLWRGIPSIVVDGENGFLVPIKTAELVAEKLLMLIADLEVRKKMGIRSRELYVEKYRLEDFYYNIESALSSM